MDDMDQRLNLSYRRNTMDHLMESDGFLYEPFLSEQNKEQGWLKVDYHAKKIYLQGIVSEGRVGDYNLRVENLYLIDGTHIFFIPAIAKHRNTKYAKKIFLTKPEISKKPIFLKLRFDKLILSDLPIIWQGLKLVKAMREEMGVKLLCDIDLHELVWTFSPRGKEKLNQINDYNHFEWCAKKSLSKVHGREIIYIQKDTEKILKLIYKYGEDFWESYHPDFLVVVQKELKNKL